MKILYAVQGTGNGHMARAEDVVPVLRKYADVDIFLSGAQADISMPFDVRYRSSGMSFYFGKNGGVDLIKTIKLNRSRRVYHEINEFPVSRYDLVINDFEPISAWAARLKGIPCVALSHQAALLAPGVPRPSHYDPVGAWILKNYAPADAHVGFHFSAFAQDVYTPVIRTSVRRVTRANNGHYTVYLPAYDDKKLIPVLSAIPHVNWHVFSKHARANYNVGRISVQHINNELFAASLATCCGVLCGSGFETPAEAMHLGKKLLVVPMKKQYEQHFNAAALAQMGVSVLKKVKKKYLDELQRWIETDDRPQVSYPDITEKAVCRTLALGERLISS